MRKLILILSVFAFAAFGQELVLNGGFEDGFEHWEQEVESPDGSYEFTRSTRYRSGPDYSARIHKYMRYYARLVQEVALPGVNVWFSADAKLLAAKGATPGHHAYAALILEYLDAGGTALGRTALMKKVGDYNPQNSPTERYVFVAGDRWGSYGLSIPEELNRLHGINPAEVAAVRITLVGHGTGTSG